MIIGCLDIGDRGKLRLTVEDVDVAALVGDRLRNRQRLIERLVHDDLFDANRQLTLPRLPLRVAVVGSSDSDGHRDLLRQLESSDFAFDVTLRAVPVEGPAAPREIRAALATLAPDDVDIAVLVRGGGAKASLDVFNQPPVAHAVATAMVPVWTGIGHTGDRTVADEVAHRSLATPSAAGQELVAHVAAAWDAITEVLAGIARLVDGRLTSANSHLDDRRRQIVTLACSQLERHAHMSALVSSDLRRCALRCLDGRAGQLTMAAHSISVSGGAELRNAQRQLANLAVETAQAARRTSADAAAELVAVALSLSTATTEALRVVDEAIGESAERLSRRVFDRLLDEQANLLARASGSIGRDTRRHLHDHGERTSSLRAVLEAYDPKRQLARGWTLTHTLDGRLVRQVTDLSRGDCLITTFATGVATSTVTGVTPHDEEDRTYE